MKILARLVRGASGAWHMYYTYDEDMPANVDRVSLVVVPILVNATLKTLSGAGQAWMHAYFSPTTTRAGTTVGHTNRISLRPDDPDPDPGRTRARLHAGLHGRMRRPMSTPESSLPRILR